METDRSGMLPCTLCGRWEDARSMGEQLGVSLCRSCDGQYDDNELRMELSIGSHGTTVEEVITKALALLLLEQRTVIAELILAVSRCQKTEELEMRLLAVQAEIYNTIIEAPDAVSHLTKVDA